MLVNILAHQYPLLFPLEHKVLVVVMTSRTRADPALKRGLGSNALKGGKSVSFRTH
jgi:hypothetical protein